MTNDMHAAPADKPSVRVVVVDGLDLLRLGIVQTLARGGASVVGEADSAARALVLLENTGADLLLIGPHVDMSVSRLVALAKATDHRPRAVHLAGPTDREEYVAILKSGVDAIEPVSCGAEALGDVVHRVVRGERSLGVAALTAVRASLAARRAEASIALTPRERDVLERLPSRRTLSEIGDELYLSTATVKSHVHRIYGKLAVNDRHAAIERALALGLLA